MAISFKQRRSGLIMSSFLLLFLFLSISMSFGQKVHENIGLGDEAFEEGDYFMAAYYYRQAYFQDTTRIKIAMKYADASRLFYNYREAAQWYEKVLRQDEKKKFPEARFWLAMMQKNLMEYPKAMENFRIYSSANKDLKDMTARRASLEIDYSHWASLKIRDSVPVKIEHLAKTINTPFSDFGAVQWADSLLLFSSLRLEKDDEYDNLPEGVYLTRLYESKVTPVGLSTPVVLPNRINEPGFHTANVCFSFDHKTAYFTRTDDIRTQHMKSSIWMSRLRGGKWQKPVLLEDPINLHSYTSTQPCVGHIGKDDVLFFVSDRPGGMGGKDIWYAIIKKTRILEPVNAGPVINTPGDEFTPFYDFNKGLLYFSSDWHEGFGGFDIFSSRYSQNEWSKPTNLGFPYNTSYNDLYFTVNENDSAGYLTSNRPGSYFIKSQTCCNDIYSWKIERPKPKIIVKDTTNSKVTIPVVSLVEQVKSLLPLTLYFHNDVPFASNNQDTSEANYKTTVAEYFLLKQKYQEEYGKGLKGSAKIRAERDIQDFFDTLVLPGMNKLDRFTSLLISDLKAGSDVKITIKGYTSPLNTSAYNKHLAQRRIVSLKNYFRDYQDGILLRYLDKAEPSGGRLRIVEEPIGKEQASKLVSDNPHDLRNSVYSRAAALERRIQIIDYECVPSKENILNVKQTSGFKENPITTVSFVEEFFDFGVVRAGSHVNHDFRLKNTGKMPLRLIAMETSCGCTVVDWPKDDINPGGTAVISISFDSSNKIGEQTESISIKANIPGGEKAIYFKATVKP